MLKDFIDSFKIHHKESHFYVGINYNSIREVESILDSSGLNITKIRLERADLYTGSDASAYQIALKLLKESNNRYQLYWFCHTKGAVHNKTKIRELYIKELFSKEEQIRNLFQRKERLGTYALRGASKSATGIKWDSFIADHYIALSENKITKELPRKHVNWSYIETMFVMRGELVDLFLELSKTEFYDTKIENRYYFEIVLPWICTRAGYFPYVKTHQCRWEPDQNLNQITARWIEEEGLYELVPYLNEEWFKVI